MGVLVGSGNPHQYGHLQMTWILRTFAPRKSANTLRKMRKFYYLFLILSVLSMALASCSKDEGGKSDTGDVYFEIDPSGIREWTAEELADELYGAEGSEVSEENAKLRKQFLENVALHEAELGNELGANGVAMGYIGYKYYYQSTDVSGETRTLSARVVWARYNLFGWHNLDPDNLYIMEHPFITDNADAPSECTSFEMGLSTQDYLLISPDGLGYGINKEMIDPYQNHEVSVKNTMDALEAGYAVWKKYGSGTMEDDWKTIILGLSEGAGKALALHKYFDTHDSEASKWHFSYSFTCAGSYDPSRTWETYYDWGKTEYIAVIPMTIKSMLASYPDVLKGYSEDDFYCEKYLALKSRIDALLAGKNMSYKEQDGKIKELLGTENPTLSDVLSETFLDKNSDIYKAFVGCLKKNDLSTGWTPKHAIKILAPKSDEFIPYASTEAIQNAFGDMVTVTSIATCDHSDICDLYHTAYTSIVW